MSERGRGQSRGGRGGRGGAGRGGGGGHGGQQKQNILDLGKYMDKKVHIKYTGGREVIGTLKGHDPLLNLVLDDTEELLRDPEDDYHRVTDRKRQLGLVVCRGTAIISISPEDGSEEIENPFVQQQEQ